MLIPFFRSTLERSSCFTKPQGKLGKDDKSRCIPAATVPSLKRGKGKKRMKFRLQLSLAVLALNHQSSQSYFTAAIHKISSTFITNETDHILWIRKNKLTWEVYTLQRLQTAKSTRRLLKFQSSLELIVIIIVDLYTLNWHPCRMDTPVAQWTSALDF